jgi:putative transcriptional regulator
MKSLGTTSVDHNSGERDIATNTDWAAVEALTDEQIAAGAANDPDAAPVPVYATPGLTAIINVKRLRERLNLTQEAFAATYSIPIGTLRDWEQRRKLPDAPARAYLRVIARNPQAIADLLANAA